MLRKAVFAVAIVVFSVNVSFAIQPQAGTWVLTGTGEFEDSLHARISFNFSISDDHLPQHIEVGWVAIIRGDRPEVMAHKLSLSIDPDGKLFARGGLATEIEGVFDSETTAHGTWRFSFLTGTFFTGRVSGEGTWTASHMEELFERLRVLNPKTREEAAKALGTSEDRRAVEPLIALLKDEEEDIGVRESAAMSLGKIKDEEAIEPLVAVLKDEDIDWRWEAVKEFRKCSYNTRSRGNLIAVNVGISGFGTEDISYVMDTSKDRYGNYRCIYALIEDEKGKITGTTNIIVPDPCDLSTATFDFSDPEKNYVVEGERSVIKAAAWALAEMKEDKRAIKALIGALEEGNVKAVAGAYKFFLEERMPGAEDALVGALNEYGDKVMAEDFLNSGNSKLQTAAQKYLEQHK